jgi:hypothetical protein
MGYYALLEFECSPDLKEVLLNNYLFNLREEVGNFIEGDLMQEWNNKWLQDVSGRGGGDFDDKFYRKTISPNVLHFLKMKEDIETPFELKRRSKARPSPTCATKPRSFSACTRRKSCTTFVLAAALVMQQ